jgi:cytochrome b561
VPLDMPDSPDWERSAARATHLAFYFILLAGPLLGWASASAHDLRVSVFGLFPLPDLAAPKTRWALLAGDVHAWMMWALLGLIALHALGALLHHFVRQDGVLRRMLPASR